jgi:hypothetical protein
MALAVPSSQRLPSIVLVLVAVTAFISRGVKTDQQSRREVKAPDATQLFSKCPQVEVARSCEHRDDCVDDLRFGADAHELKIG